MNVQPFPPLSTLLTSNEGLKKNINTLEDQMQGLDAGSPEYMYDQLHLDLEKEKQRIRDENPSLDPLNPADAKKLDELLDQDPDAQAINNEISEMISLYPSEASGWGIPLYFTEAVPAQ